MISILLYVFVFFKLHSKVIFFVVRVLVYPFISNMIAYKFQEAFQNYMFPRFGAYVFNWFPRIIELHRLFTYPNVAYIYGRQCSTILFEFQNCIISTCLFNLLLELHTSHAFGKPTQRHVRFLANPHRRINISDTMISTSSKCRWDFNLLGESARCHAVTVSVFCWDRCLHASNASQLHLHSRRYLVKLNYWCRVF